MNVSSNLRLRFVLIAVAALAAVGAGTMVLSKAGHTSSAPPKQIKPLHPVRQNTHGSAGATQPALKHKATARPQRTATPAPSAHKSAPPARPTKKHSAVVHPPAKTTKPAAKHMVLPALPGVPPSVARALASHRVVVVALFAPGAGLDMLALNEASAGARAAGASFVALDVTNQAEALPLAKTTGVFHDPALLVFRSPGHLVLRIDGFADRETVAQAAANFGAKAPPHRKPAGPKKKAGKHKTHPKK